MGTDPFILLMGTDPFIRRESGYNGDGSYYTALINYNRNRPHYIPIIRRESE